VKKCEKVPMRRKHMWSTEKTFEKAKKAWSSEKNLPMCRIFVRGAVSICAVKTSCSDTNAKKRAKTPTCALKKWYKLSNTLINRGVGSNVQKIFREERVSKQKNYANAEKRAQAHKNMCRKNYS
jgi:hypothetical protein